MRSEGITKLTTVKRKANVGERIIITNAGFTSGDYENGRVAEVMRNGSQFPETIIHVKEWESPVHISEYQVLVVADGTSTRLSEAEAKIAELEAEVAALKLKADEPSITLDESFLPPLPGEVVRFRGVKASDFEKTPNQRRADVIKRAQAFVADLEERAQSCENNDDGNGNFNGNTTRLKFHVNAEKRVVTALAHGVWGFQLYDKAFAKCHPNDVFNADIGKAIAAGKLYGVDIPREFVDAPKPTEFAVGQVTRIPLGNEYVITVIRGDEARTNPGGFHRKSEFPIVTITDDTDAVYV